MTARRTRLPRLLPLAFALAAGCYTGSARDVSPDRIAADPDWRLVRGVPFIPQRADDDCGAAALAMVLSYHHVPTSRQAVLAEVPPQDGGMTAGALRDYARRRGLQAFVVAGNFADVQDQIQRGRPLVVGLVKPMLGRRGLAHFEVVVGFNRRARRVLTLDPARGLRESSAEGFAREWVPAGQAALFVLPPSTKFPGSAER
jgi:ABC-type bacteriocin/lantibiotic exporter with double-glycine peptidase domain